MYGTATKNTWDQVLGRVESKVSAHTYRTWFKPTQFLSEDASSLTIRVPNSWFAEWLKTNYSGLIQDALRELQRPGLSVDYRLEVPEFVPGGTLARTGPWTVPTSISPPR